MQKFILALWQICSAWSTDQITKPHYTEYILKIFIEIQIESIHMSSLTTLQQLQPQV